MQTPTAPTNNPNWKTCKWSAGVIMQGKTIKEWIQKGVNDKKIEFVFCGKVLPLNQIEDKDLYSGELREI